MAVVSLDTSSLGNGLNEILMAPEIQPGDQASYALCKQILTYHPLGLKMTRAPIKQALAKRREIAIPGSPEEHTRRAFEDAWEQMAVDDKIADCMTLARAYGVSTITLIVEDDDPANPPDFTTLHARKISFNVLDPLNTSGSMTRNLDPNSPTFLKVADNVTVAGQTYHRARCVTVFHEQAIYLSFTSSGFGYVGRSIFQRALFPMKTFIRTMVTDDLVTSKVGVLVAKLKTIGSIVDNVIALVTGRKRELVKEAQTGSVISITNEEAVESLNLLNLEGPFELARKNILDNIAIAADMPAKFLQQETMTEGFGEGTEDAKNVVRYLEGLRADMKPLYDFFDRIVMYRAWTPEFFVTMQNMYPEELGALTYETAFYQWANAFVATWPSLIEEPESEKIKVEETKFQTVNSVVAIMLPVLDPLNKSALLQWAQDNLNENTRLFPVPLSLNFDTFEQFAQQQQMLATAETIMGGGANEDPYNKAGISPPHTRPHAPAPKMLGDSQPDNDEGFFVAAE